MFLNPPSCPKRSSKQSYCENLPPRNNCNILFILILYCGLCPCSQSHHSVRWFVVDLCKRFSATPKKKYEDVFKFYVVACLRCYVGDGTTLRCYDCYMAESYDTSWSSTSCSCSFCSVSPVKWRQNKTYKKTYPAEQSSSTVWSRVKSTFKVSLVESGQTVIL